MTFLRRYFSALATIALFALKALLVIVAFTSRHLARGAEYALLSLRSEAQKLQAQQLKARELAERDAIERIMREQLAAAAKKNEEK